MKLINRIRGILDIRSLVLSIRKHGVPLSVALQFKKFPKNSRALCSKIENVDDGVIQDQYHSMAPESGFKSTLTSKFIHIKTLQLLYICCSVKLYILVMLMEKMLQWLDA